MTSPTPRSAPPRGSTSRFGRIFSSPFSGARSLPEAGNPITVVPRSDPAADAALKRRIERQIEDSLGDRVRSVDVRVVGRDVTIRARSTRFWQRRGVRRALESLPGLTGYRSSIAVVD
jgi:hypothetical protein